MIVVTYHGWTLRRVGVSWYAYAPGEPVDFRHGRHHSSREAAREYVRAQVAQAGVR